MKQLLREIPAVHHFTHDLTLMEWVEANQIPEELFTQLVKETIESIRRDILAHQVVEISYSIVLEKVKEKIRDTQQQNLRPVINGTGVILHTNLGRAVLAQEAIDQMVEIATGYSNLEYRIEEGKRGSRHDHVEDLIRRLTGAEAAMVVNNNAAAVYLVLREMAKDKEVIVSRGQLVEIGGSFRVSEIMKESGAILREVGTTNKTHTRDYEQVMNENTALLLKVHTSNFAMSGFTKTVSLEELVELGKSKGVPVYEDLGSGVLYDLRKHGIGDEPVIHESIQQGADVVTFSGDKLLGGPQVGVIAGKKEWIDRFKKNQLARVLRVDKVTLAALEATLRLYLNPRKAAESIPALRDMLMPMEEVRARAESFRDKLEGMTIEVREDKTEVGGGSLPGVLLPTVVAVLHHDSYPAHVIERKLRTGNPVVVGRITKDEYILDFRTIHPREIPLLVEAIYAQLT
ncbi:L-seryl-tRNA(Sec) selenium transferase [Ammoniphilus sp. CFH 90114]|nr:L-seryl-tRNA(Sec) selenium transferase [Ammoniphilus sp. CFH 90114]